MIEASEQGEDEFIKEALDLMPNFSDSLQSNSILTRRILKLKSEKGFTISKEDAEKAREAKPIDSSVSSALTSA